MQQQKVSTLFGIEGFSGKISWLLINLNYASQEAFQQFPDLTKRASTILFFLRVNYIIEGPCNLTNPIW